MTGWFVININNHYFEKKLEEDYYERIKNDFQKYNINLEKYNNIDAQFLLLNGKKPDFCYYMDKDVNVTKKMENLGIRCFCSAKVIEICDDKSKSFNFLEKCGIPQPKTVFSPLLYKNEMDLEKFVDETINYLGPNLVIKECIGTCGNEVYLAIGKDAAIKKISEIKKPYIIQEQIVNSFGKDIRAHMIGNKLYGAILRESHNGDFRSNIGRGGTATLIDLDKDTINMCAKICDELKSDFLGIDLLIDKDCYKVGEINSNSYYILDNNPLAKTYAEEVVKYIKERI